MYEYGYVGTILQAARCCEPEVLSCQGIWENLNVKLGNSENSDKDRENSKLSDILDLPHMI